MYHRSRPAEPARGTASAHGTYSKDPRYGLRYLTRLINPHTTTSSLKLSISSRPYLYMRNEGLSLVSIAWPTQRPFPSFTDCPRHNHSTHAARIKSSSSAKVHPCYSDVILLEPASCFSEQSMTGSSPLDFDIPPNLPGWPMPPTGMQPLQEALNSKYSSNHKDDDAFIPPVHNSTTCSN